MPHEAQVLAAPTAAERGGRVTMLDVHREFVAHAGNWPFLALAIGIAGGLLITGAQWADAAWLAFGLLLFVPQEYFTHVWLLHRRLPRTQRGYEWMYRLHYGHHDHPRRHDLMYMPMWLTLPMMGGNLLLFWLLTPDTRAFWAAFGGATLGYLVFEWSHLLCHVPFVPKSRLWRHVRSQHLLHHFADEKRGFSVAPWSLFMDTLMRTQLQRGAGPRSSSCRYLGLEAGHPWIAQARERFAAHSSGDATASRLWQRAAARDGTS
jgi:hypothetical protein